MKCPYCIEEVNEAALACPHCTRDLYLFKPLLAQLGELESELVKVKARLEQLEVQRKQPSAAAMSAGIVESSGRSSAAAEGAMYIYWLWLAPLALLVAAHLFITIIFDINLVWLRMVSLLIPLPFGYLLMSRGFRSFPIALCMALLVACVAVIAMSGTVHLVDGTAVFPQNSLGWREFVEYAASILFSFTTGMVIGRMVWRRRQAEQLNSLLLSALVGAVMGTGTSVEKLNTVISSVENITKSVVATGTSFAAIYTGMHTFF
jgi:hypothetical protein